MTDERKTKRQLVEELQALRRRVTELETQSAGPRQADRSAQGEAQQPSSPCSDIPLACHLVDGRGRLLEVNQAWLDLLGYSREQVVGRRFGDFLVAQGKDGERQRLAHLKAAGEIHGAEIEVMREDGSRLTVSIDEKAVRDERGAVRQALCILQDVTARGQAEEALEGSERTFRAVAEQSPSMIFVNAGGRVVYANERCEDIMEYTREDLYAPDFDFLTTLIAPEHRDLIRANYARHMRGEDVDPYEYALITRDGQRIESIINTRLIDYAGQKAVLGIVTDITWRKQAEEALRESEERYRLLLQNANDAIYVHEVSPAAPGSFLDVNERACEMLGYTREEFLSMGVGSIDVEEQRARIPAILEALYKTGHAIFSTEHLAKDGRRIPVETSVRLFRLRGKDTVLSVVRDVSERKLAEEALQRERSLLNRIAETSPVGITVVNRDGYVVFANPAAERVLGLAESEITQRTYNDLGWCITDHEGKPFAEEQLPFQQVMATGQPVYGVRHAIERPDGQRVLLSVNAAPLIDSTGHFDGMVATVEDTTEPMRMEQTLRESEARYRALFDHMNDGVAIYEAVDGGRDFIFVSFNQGGERIENLSKRDLIGKSILETFPRIREFGLYEVLQRVWATGEPEMLPVAMYQDERITGWRENYVYKLPSGEIVAIYSDETKRKQAEEALRRAYREWESIFQAIGHSTLILDPQNTIIAANRAAAEITGRSEEDLIGEKCFKIFHGAETSEPPERCPLEKMRKSARTETAQMEAEALGGTFLISCTPMLDEKGNLEKVVHIATDITESSRAERALQEAYTFRTSIIERAAEGLCVCHDIPDYPYVAFTVWNHRMAEITGYSMDEINRRGWYQTVYPDPDLQARAAERMGRMRHGDDLHAEPWEITRADGEKRVLNITTSVLKADDTTHVLALMNDVTDRVRAEQALQKSKTRLQSILQAAPTGIGLLSPDGALLQANDQICEMLGYPLDELLGRSTRMLYRTDEEYEAVEQERNRQIAADGTAALETRWKRKDGRPIEVLLRTTPTDPRDQAAGLTFTALDITERKQLEEQVLQQERLAAVGQLAGGIAHDFNNLLTTIILYAQLPMGREDLSPDVVRSLETILTESRQATEMVQQILDFSRRSPIETHPVDLKPFIKETMRVLQRIIPENISPLLEIGAGKYMVNADPTRIQQVLMNLLVNARDAMPDGGVLRVSLDKVAVSAGKDPPLPEMAPGQWIHLSVADTGTGIPGEILPHVFEPFFTTKPRGEGSGLGLAQVYGIVKQHEGHIGLETEAGLGTTFHIYLPAYAASGKPSRGQEAPNTPPGKGEVILLVEDNERIREAGRQILEMLGYQVITAVNGSDGVRAYQAAERVDLVLTDMVMPEMGGRQLVQKLREAAPDLRAVAITGHMQLENLQDLKEEGIRDVIQKPFDSSVLAQTIRRVLDED